MTTPPISLDALGAVRVAHEDGDGRHLIIADPAGDHRLWFRAGVSQQSLAFVVRADHHMALRLTAIDRLMRRHHGKPSGAWPIGCAPTSFMRHRLSQLLAILDAIRASASNREIVHNLLYRHMAPLGRAAWKGSNERRRTRRLVAEAQSMMRTGYIALINGC